MTGNATSQNTPRTARQTARRWPKRLFALSLTLNMLVLAMVAGAFLRDSHDHRHMRPSDRRLLRDGGLGPFFDALPPAARRDMAEAFRASGQDRGPDRAALAADLRAFVAAVRAEPFDPTAAAEVLAAQTARVQTRVTAGQAILVDQIATMSAGDRAAFADRLERCFPGAVTRSPGGRGPEAGREDADP